MGWVRNAGASRTRPQTRSPPILNRCLAIHASSTEATNWFLTSTGLAKFLNQFAIDFQLCWKEVDYLCLIALGLSLVLTVLFRFLAGAMIWLLLVALVLGSFGGTGYLWWAWYGMRGTSGETSMLAYAITLSIISVLILLIVVAMRKRVELVAALFREATTPLFLSIIIEFISNHFGSKPHKFRYVIDYLQW
ncbi:hypothetical protein DAPPUDRAFT_325589 [Daphnia pulex]|uniref:Uncharacterized protein n=1 Tax=Daphnia pulex TaxID=6669 RepID=E9H573_DAPPU|nr:hypothetical protein DAPPUDRAFT_325589 [Daphnia pulex]|eukprot:EFX73127.1 hypothetical protein DAPPUDRAFT_325589 [Daphnia pulex]